MQKCLFSAPDGPAGPGGVPDGAADGVIVKASQVAGAPVSTDSTAPALVWPPSDEDLDDWHVIQLEQAAAAGPAAAAAAEAAPSDAAGSEEAGKGAGKAARPDDTGTMPARKPLPAWLANHKARSSGNPNAEPVGTVGAPTLNLAPRANPAAGSNGMIRAVPSSTASSSSSPLEDTAKLPGDTTTAISVRRPSAAGSAASAAASTSGEGASALGLAAVAKPAAPRAVATFPAARQRPAAPPAPSPWNGVARRTAIIVLGLLAVGQAAYIGARLLMTPDAANASVLTVDSAPDGAEVLIDGERRGVTPFKVELPAGSHSLELRKNGRTRTIPLVLAAGVQASQYVELNASSAGSAPASAAGAPAATPSSAAPRPAAPLTPPQSTSTDTPVPADGAAPAAADAVTPPIPSRGWVVVESGLNLRVLRNGELLGTSEEGRLALSAGRHELELVNDTVGYRATVTVQVPPGRAVQLPVELPQSVLNLTSTPSARVWVDGREIGTTPVSQLALPVGQHEVRFDHPDYGERRMTVLVRVGVTAQAAVDFTR